MKDLEVTANVGAWEVDVRTMTSTWSDQTYRIHEKELGTPTDVSRGIEYYLPRFRTKIQSYVERSIKTGESWDDEFQIQTEKDNVVWVRAKGRADFENGEVVRLSGTLQNIDEIIKDRKRLENLLNNSNDLLFEIDSDGFYRDVRVGDEVSLFVPKDEVIGKNLKDIFGDEFGSSVIKQIRRTIKTGKPETLEYEAPVARQEKQGWFRARIFRELGDSLVQVSIHEITELRDALEKLESERLLAFNSARLAEIGEVAGGIAHEVNNPLAIIQGYAGSILKSIERGEVDQEKVLDSCRRIDTTCTRIAKIIQGLRTYARDGSQDLFEPVEIDKLLNDTMNLCTKKLISREIKIETLNLFESGTKAECRSVQIVQVLINLINNAVDAVENSKEKWIKLEVRPEDGGVCFLVSDSGEGISKEIVEKITQPFFTTKAVGKGTGLGLSISQGIISEHGGKFEYDLSSDNTLFKIWIPLSRDS